MARVYISSTYEDLIDEREAAAQAVRRLGHQAIAMEDYVASDNRPVDQCVADVKTCDAYVGIVAWRYGFIPPGYHKSITHLEYEAAIQADIPCLLFLLDEDAAWSRKKMDRDAEPVDQFREALSKERIVSFFENHDGLDALVSAAVSNTLREATPSRPDIPDLLPYLSDRSEQRRELKNMLRDGIENNPRRPFVSIVHGDERECHDKFLEHTEIKLLPTILALDTSIQNYLVPWASRPASVAARLNVWRTDLADKLLGLATSTSSSEAIANKIFRDRKPVMIESHLNSDEWLDDEPALIERWLQFWEAFSDLPAGRPLFVFLVIHYENTAKLSFLKRWKAEKRSDQIRACSAAIEWRSYKHLNGVTLSELRAVRQRDVEDWVRDRTTDFCHDADLLEQVRTLFQEAEQEAIPMEKLAKNLRTLMAKCRH